MEFKCCKCGNLTSWDPIKEGGSTPPGFVMKKHNGKVETFCLACWPRHEEHENETDENRKELKNLENSDMPINT
jgi:hypothetical protein